MSGDALVTLGKMRMSGVVGNGCAGVNRGNHPGSHWYLLRIAFLGAPMAPSSPCLPHGTHLGSPFFIVVMIGIYLFTLVTPSKRWRGENAIDLPDDICSRNQVKIHSICCTLSKMTKLAVIRIIGPITTKANQLYSSQKYIERAIATLAMRVHRRQKNINPLFSAIGMVPERDIGLRHWDDDDLCGMETLKTMPVMENTLREPQL